MTKWSTVTCMPNRNNNDEILTARQLADEWRVSVRTIQRYVVDGRLKAVRLPGRQLRIKRADANAARLSAKTA